MADVKVKKNDIQKVIIKKNAFYKEDTEVELQGVFAQKLVDAGKAYFPGQKQAGKAKDDK